MLYSERFNNYLAVERKSKHMEPCCECGWAMVAGTTGQVFCINEHPGLAERTISQPLSPLEILNTLTREEKWALGNDQIEEFRRKHAKH